MILFIILHLKMIFLFILIPIYNLTNFQEFMRFIFVFVFDSLFLFMRTLRIEIYINIAIKKNIVSCAKLKMLS